MVDVKTEERHAHEHEILLGKYENGNLNFYYTDFWMARCIFRQNGCIYVQLG
mgnify:CR=1 FL=1